MRREAVEKYLEKYSLGVVDAGNSLAQYDSFFRNMGFKEPIEDLIRKRLSEKGSPVKVMDIGCGNAGFLRDLKKMFGECVETIGVDLVEPADGGGVDEMVVGDALEMPFQDDVDFVFSFRSLHEIGEPEKIVEKVYNCLSPGGKAFLSFRTMGMYTMGVHTQLPEKRSGNGGDGAGLSELGEKEVKALQRMVRSRKLVGFRVSGFEVRVGDEKGKKHTAGVNVFLEK